MKEVSTGDKFRKRGNEYIVCSPGGAYYLINLETGDCWSDGMSYEQLLLELTSYNFEKIK